MAPIGRFPENNIHFFQPNEKTRLSAVLIAFYMKAGKLHFPLIVRPDNSGVHSGQVALPGGKKDEDDKDLITTALREMEEEMGVIVPRETVLGELSHFFIPPSNFLVYPILAYLPETPLFLPNPTEVVRVLEIEVADFLQEDKRKQKVIQASYMKGEMPYYDLQDHTVWGATAMILSELRHIWLEIFADQTHSIIQ
jgi:8-oxo-dGTP pyrophosphatase MutT (NUDIX family)